MADIPTMTEWIRQFKAVEKLRELWFAVEFDPVARDLYFPPGTPLRVAWDQPYIDEETALAAGYVAVWE